MDEFCRMYQSRLPLVDTVAMVRIESVNLGQNFAVVSLVEYDNIKGRLRFTQQDRVVLGQVQPAFVSCVRRRFRFHRRFRSARLGYRRILYRSLRKHSIKLNLLVSEERRNNCEVSYTKNIQVRSILRHLADARDSSLLDTYEATNWPSYDNLKNPLSGYWNSLHDIELRDALKLSVSLVKYESLRISDNHVFAPCNLVENGGHCSTVALLRQYEALLKMKRRLSVGEFLSLEDFINLLPEDMVDERGVKDMNEIAEILLSDGVISGRDAPRSRRTRVYKPSDVSVVYYPVGEDDSNDVDPLLKYHQDYWHITIMNELTRGPIAASVIWFPSYKGIIGEGTVLTPTDEEVSDHIDNPKEGQVHTMTLSGHGVDERLNAFWEFQDTNGRANHGDRGFIRFSQREDPSLIIEYVTMEL